MSISKINNNFYLSQSRKNLPSQSFRSFKATEKSEISNNFDENEGVVNKFSEDDLVFLAAREPDKRLHQVSKNALKALFVTIPLADTVIQGALKGGSLSSKLMKSSYTAAKWAGIFSAGLAVIGAKTLVNSNFKEMDQFDKKHPVMSMLIDFAAFYALFNTLKGFSSSIKAGVKNHFPAIYEKFKNVAAIPVKNALNNSFVNKKLVQPAEKFFVKRPYLTGTSKMLSYLLVPAAIVSVIVRLNKESKIRDEQAAGNYTALKIINDYIPDEKQ